MNTLRELLRDYLALRRGLGFKLRSDGTGLLSFVAFMEQAQADYISTERALAWAQLPTSVRPAQRSRRLGFVRGFARYCSAFDTRTEIPSSELLPRRYQRPRPYFVTDNDLQRLLRAALKFPAREPLVNRTFYCLFGLLSVSGLRISEALGLTLDDVDLDEGVLTIRSSKFGKSRLIPLHCTTTKELDDYRAHREHLLAGRQVPYWLVNRQGKRLGYDAVDDMFRRLLAKIGLRGQPGERRPHLHDLRHRFAVLTVLNWYRADVDVERRLPMLSAYLGHVEIRNTYWYLSASPELMGEARARLEQHWERQP